MSVTVEDLLGLLSLRRAKVLGGHRGLSKKETDTPGGPMYTTNTLTM